MPTTIKKTDRLPKLGYKLLTINDALMESDEYNENISKGLPFYTKEQLSELENRYKEGMTWKEIDTELAGKGIIFKKATFRKYIQEKKLPPAINYKKTSKGREAVYPKETIRHINLFQYLTRIANNKIINVLIEAISSKKVTAFEAIQGELDSQNLYAGVLTYLRGISWEGDDIEGLISDTLRHDPEFYQKVISGLENMQATFDEQYREWEKMLQHYEIQISTMTDDEE